MPAGREKIQEEEPPRRARAHAVHHQRQDQDAEDRLEEYLAEGIDALKSNCADLMFDNVIGLTANAVRGAIVASFAKLDPRHQVRNPVMFVVLMPGAAPPAFAFRMPSCSANAPYLVPES